MLTLAEAALGKDIPSDYWREWVTRFPAHVTDFEVTCVFLADQLHEFDNPLTAAWYRRMISRLCEREDRYLVPLARPSSEVMALSIMKALADDLRAAAKALEQGATWLNDPSYIGGGTRADTLRRMAARLSDRASEVG